MPWLYTLGGAVLALALSLVPLAGLDADLEYMPSIVDRLQLGGLLVAIWPWFLGGRAAARLSRWRKAAFAGTVVLSAASTAAFGSAMMEVLLPRQAMVLAVSGAGGAAALWWLCDRLRQHGAMGGTMTVLAGLLILDLPRLAYAIGASLGDGEQPLIVALSALALAGPGLLGFLLWRRLPARPPDWLPVKHPVELVLLPLAAAELAIGLRSAAPGLPYWIDALAMVAVTVAIAHLTRADTRGLPSLALSGGLLSLVSLGGVGLGLVDTKDVLATRYVDGPLEGIHSVRVLCTAPGADLAEMDRMRERMKALRIEGDVQLLDDMVQLELLEIAEPSEVVAILTAPNRFEIRAESDDPVLTVADCVGCVPVPLGPPILTNTHIADAVMTFGFDDRPVVMLEFTSDGKATFAQITRELVGQRIGLMLDGQLLSAPVVMEPITGGTAQITSGDASVDEAQITATLLSLEPLESDWVVRDIQEL